MWLKSLFKPRHEVSRAVLVAIVVTVIITTTIGTYLLLQTQSPNMTVTGEIVIQPFNPKAYDYNFVLSINVSEDEVGAELTVRWNSFIVLYSPRMVAWSVPALVGLTTENQTGESEPFNMLASELVDSPPLLTGFVIINQSSGEVVKSPWVVPLDQIYLYWSEPYPYEGLKCFFACLLREQGVGWDYTFTEPGNYTLVHKYPMDVRLKEVLKNAGSEFNPGIVTIIHAYLRSPLGQVVFDKRFQLRSVAFPVASWSYNSMSYFLDNQSIVVPEGAYNVSVSLSWDASTTIYARLYPYHNTEHELVGGSEEEIHGSLTYLLQPGTYYIAFHVAVKDVLDGGRVKYDVTFPRDSGVWVWQGSYTNRNWRGWDLQIIWGNQEVLKMSGVG